MKSLLQSLYVTCQSSFNIKSVISKKLELPKYFFLVVFLSSPFFSLGQGSRTLAPNYPGTAALDAPNATPSADNDDFAWLEHDGPDSDDFLDPSAPAARRLFVYLRAGETLRYGIRRIAVRYDGTNPYATATIEGNNQDLSIIVFDNGGTIQQATHFNTDVTSAGDATLLDSNGAGTDGIIGSVAESLLGPEFTFNTITYNTGGYEPREYTNNTGSDQAFYIVFLQDNYTFTTEAQLIIDVGAATIADVNVRSWYDLWDFTVYDGSEEKPGRVYSGRWSFTAQDFENELADEMELFARIPSTISGVSAGNYVKQIDLGGLDPFSLIAYASSTGADLGSVGDTNGDGVTDFQDARQTQGTDIGAIEYDLFLSNPDLDIFPTTTLPTVEITDAAFYCNNQGSGGEATIFFSTNQTGFIAVLVDLNGVNGYQDGTTDVIIEQEVTVIGDQILRWDGLDGNNAVVSSGTEITISGRFTSGPLHVPLFDVEENGVGIQMLDVRPNTSFDLIYWDDSNFAGAGSSPQVELDGTNTDRHLWTDGDTDLLNTWSFGFYQINTQVINFNFSCDADGDGILDHFDLDSDNDGLTDAIEGDFRGDADGDNVPDYVDTDLAGFVDANGDGVNDNFDSDMDGIPNAIDLDSDNDGIPDIVEFGLTDANNDGTLDEGSGITDLNANGLDDAYDANCTGAGSSASGNATAVFSSANFVNTGNAVGAINFGASTSVTIGATLVMDLGVVVPAGEDISISVGTSNTAGIVTSIEQSADGSTFPSPNQQYYLTATPGFFETITYTLTADSRYIRFTFAENPNAGTIFIDALVYNYNITACAVAAALAAQDTDSDTVADYLDLDSDNDGIVDVTEAGGTAGTDGRIASFADSDGNGRNDAQEATALTPPDSDADGSLADYLEIDSDNDGILDNVESQASDSFIASAAGDTDGNGLLDVYDPNNGGTLITPVDTDSDGTEDYLDDDSDGDGVEDFIEGWDSDRDGFSNLDTNEDRLISDETGYNVDTDTDGLWDIFESSAAPTPNSDGSDKSDWQDTDDDNDGTLTSGEDVNGNSNWTDDFTQGQGTAVVGTTTPDYLFRGDFDGDAIADASDLDSDNDGILDSDEDNGEAIDPSGDVDGDGIANYADADDTGVTDFIVEVDSNGDGVWDNYDTDLDGKPDFLDLDSDNDGIWDAVEANAGSVPFGLDETEGLFTLQDPDNDGLMNFVDSDDVAAGGTSDLANPDTDSDGLADYRDIDSDNDGITDIREAQTTAAFITFANNDADGDGIDDNFDPNNGGTLITPINSDGIDQQDYRDTDSDNDNVSDAIEGDDANNDGVGAWDDNSNGLTDEADFSADADSDGLVDAFDNVALGTVDNEIGSNVALQNTDGIDFLDYRDENDDNDTALTIDEDANSNGDYSDDQTAGQSGLIPDYLFNGDKDNDGIVDASDADSDNDGIPDTEEDGGESVSPSADADGDGIPNYKDADDTGVTNDIVEVDSNGDGVWDNYDMDLDGIPDFLDLDSDNDGIPDLREVNGTDTDGDGKVDGLEDSDNDGIVDAVDVNSAGTNGGSGVDTDDDGIDDTFDVDQTLGTDTDGDSIDDAFDTDIDGDGLPNTYDTDNGGTAITPQDTDGDGNNDFLDIDSDNDGLTDIIEAGGTDSDGDGRVDSTTDTDADGQSDTYDPDNGGTVLALPDSDNDGRADYLDVDSDNDGITDTLESGREDTDNNGEIDGSGTDTDGDGLPDAADTDNGGTAVTSVDTDGDGLADYQDLDSDNDGYQDILEAGGSDSDNDGIVNNFADSDDDGVPDNVDVDNFGTNGGSGSDSDGDEIDNSFDSDQTLGSDTDGDSIDNTFDTDSDGDGFDDDTELTPYSLLDTDGDGNSNFRDLDSDNDGIIDVTEFGAFTADAATGGIGSFTDANTNGWNDAQEATVIVPVNSDGDALSIPDYLDLDSDDDGIVDNFESQTKLTYISISGNDTDSDGLDDAYDPNNGGSIITPVNTDAAGNEDYLDTDSDADNVNDIVEGSNANFDQFGDWDADTDGNFDDTGFNTDVDSDGILDIFDTFTGTGSSQVTGSNAAVQDRDFDSIWGFQDTDDDGDGLLTSSQGGGNEDSNSDNNPTNDFDDDPGLVIPNYLFGNDDADGDGVVNSSDADSDNDGLADLNEDGGTGIDPSGDIDGDGIPNYQDADMDGDGTVNTSESGPFTFADSNADGTIDEYDFDLDGVPDFLDLDSDNDGIADVLELGLTDANEDGTLDEGGGLTDANGNGLEDIHDAGCVNITGGTFTGNATAVFASTSLINAATNATGAPDATGTFFDNTSDLLVLDLGTTILSGEDVTVTIGATTAGGEFVVDQSTDGTNFINAQLFTTTGAWVGNTYTLAADAQYIRFRLNVTPGGFQGVDAIGYNYTVAGGNPCGVTGTELATTDTDADNIPNHQDLDSDNDGISDNVEAQLTASYTAPVALDSDGDGLFDVYDEDISAGNALLPIDTETAGTDDYLNTDSDGDGVLDQVEGFDANSDGIATWDSDNDGDITDEAGYNIDTDTDGIWDIYDSNSGIGTAANVAGTNADRQDTDADTAEDWRDTDDDDDGTVTGTGIAGSGEDANSNANWSDDFTEGGGSTPNYLFNADADGDGVNDVTDLDSDQDGVLNTDEYAGALYASSGTPFDDNDADGIYNYLDTSDAGNTSFVDANGDGVDDQVDQDRDGIPNFFDLDSDNDGIMDAIEANDGTVPTGFNTTTGRYGVDNSGGDDDDDDNDGLNDNPDATPLANGNTDSADGDSLNDFLDLDSDNDGITDHVEGQTTAAFANPSGNDTDMDGLDDTFDADNGGTAITPTNTDGTDNPDYRDTDSDNDNDGDGVLLDVIEGYDANRNGFSELDSDLDGLLTDEAGHNVDTDGDGLWDLFDTFSGRGTSNIIGSSADLQNTDGDAFLDFRDTDDDGDALTTAGEDVNNNGDWTDDKVQGGGATPDYLFFNDSDGDRVADGADNDGDNDGLPDTDEYDATTLRDPFGDQDADGLFNYNDPDDPTNLASGPLTDSNGDGVWDEYDYDLDGVPDFFDLDSDNDGIPDIVEAGGTDSDNDGKIDGVTDTDGDGIFDNVDVDITMGTDADFDGIDDSFQDGTDTDGDGIEDTADLDIDGDGIIDTVDPTEGGTALTNPDTDGDGINNVYDLDSDNDGIVDLIEAGGNEADGDGQIDSFGDTDGDGLGNAVDPDNGGSPYPFYDSDVDLTLDYLERDADADGAPDWNEGFDDDEDYGYLNDYESRRAAYETANGNPGHYPTTDVSPANGIPDYLDGGPNFLDPGNATYYRDSDSDGIVDLFDPDANGVQYGGVSGVPDNNGNLTPNYRENGDVPLPLDWVSFTATYTAGDVDLVWQTANEINVSHFDIEHSVDGENFEVVGTLNANNTEGFNTYMSVHRNPVNGTNFYRLNQVDFDGASDYSLTRFVTATVGNVSFIVYPNPAKNLLTISADAIITGTARVIDLNGRIVWRSKLSATNEEKIDISDLSEGVYQLVIDTPQGTVIKKIVKK